MTQPPKSYHEPIDSVSDHLYTAAEHRVEAAPNANNLYTAGSGLEAVVQGNGDGTELYTPGSPVIHGNGGGDLLTPGSGQANALCTPGPVNAHGNAAGDLFTAGSAADTAEFEVV